MSSVWGDSFSKACRPRSKLTGSEWADKYRYIAPGTSPEPGEWRTSRVPYLREPMDVSTDRTTETIVLMCSSQVGKSEFLLNVMGYYVDQEPAPQLMLQPTIEAAEAFSKERIDPTFKHSSGLKGKLEESRNEGRGSSRKSANTIRMKHYAGGYIAMVGSNSATGLSSRPIRILLADETDRYESIKEGDPLALAIQRTTNFHNKKICLVSTPTVSGSSKIEDWFNKSDQRYYHVPCQHCGTGQSLKWSQVKWDKDDAGNVVLESSRYECEHCGEVMRGYGRPDQDMLQAGWWVKTKPSSRIAGFHLSSLYSPWVELYKLVEEFTNAQAKRDKEGLMEFINLKLGEPWVERADDEFDYEHIHKKRREYYSADLPEGVLLLTAGVDTQPNRLEVEVVGWGIDKESWGIEYKVFMGDPSQNQVWEQLDSYLQREWFFEDGSSMGIACTCIDMQGHNTDDVLRFTKPRQYRRVFAIRGVGGEGKPFISKPSTNNRMGAVHFNIAVDSGKAAVMSRLKIEEEGAGYCHYPRDAERGYDLEYFRGLLSEKLEFKYINGKTSIRWVKIYERNEPLDIRNYATAAMEILNPDFDVLENHKDKGNVYVQVAAAAAKTRGRRRVISRGVT